MHSTWSFLFLIVSTTLLIVTSGQDEACGTIAYGCGAHGRCRLDTQSCGNNCTERCICNDGFDGDDCSIRLDICPDTVSPDGARSCLHGGKCQQNSETQEWTCDCSSAKKGGKMYAGHQCEFAAQVSCEIGKVDSVHAFCTNGGTCNRMVKPGEHHPLCDCDENWEGRHCQYEKGSRPVEEPIYAIPGPPAKEGISGGAIFGIVVVCLIVSVTGALYWMRSKGSFKSNIKMPSDFDAKPEPNIKEEVVEASSEFI
ncbi:hypothetical protein FisN_17Lh073 [Fistulifera solaris]|uniref:EGF-like domain-containing protein n=1 Tax=Fistulifera solaris TaxID=1519565 RepID=A0A1Z5K240_FISSO|nr:hypothetical protein FisN_17Lh073 [Fistulifera solaris]|eukprot:GAX20121.1 hypothetical protein FisN_17Lh073 [Fistulifera solaris]